MPAQMTLRNAMATAWAAEGNTFSLHTGAPGSGGTDNEATGPDYERLATTWGTASGGTITGSTMPFEVDGDDFPYACRWDGSTLLNVFDITSMDVSISPSGIVEITPSYTYPVDAD